MPDIHAAPQQAVDFLKAQRCDEIEHKAQRSLLTHLLATHALLVAWQRHEDIALAGLFHSIYGTSHFEPSCLDPTPENRSAVCGVIGPQAERLAFLFSTMDRNTFLDNPSARSVPSRLSPQHLTLENGDSQALCDILLANQLDHAIALKGADRPDKIAGKIAPYYDLIGGHLSQAAREAYAAATARPS